MCPPNGFILATQTLWKFPFSVSIAVGLQYFRRPSVMETEPTKGETGVIGSVPQMSVHTLPEMPGRATC